MKKTFLSLLLVILPFLGLLDAGYVSYEVFSQRVPVCRPPFQCATFLENGWAYIVGLPLSTYGFVFYILVLILAVMNFLEIQPQWLKSIKKTLRALAVFGLMFAVYVVILMQWVVKAWCLWCLGSIFVLSGLFITSRFLTKDQKNEAKKITED